MQHVEEQLRRKNCLALRLALLQLMAWQMVAVIGKASASALCPRQNQWLRSRETIRCVMSLVIEMTVIVDQKGTAAVAVASRADSCSYLCDDVVLCRVASVGEARVMMSEATSCRR